MEDELYHVGTPHEGMIPHSGRWPYGSGKNPGQHPKDFYATILHMMSQGMTEEEIRKSFKMSVEQYRAEKSNSKMANREVVLDLNQQHIDNGIKNRSERARLISEEMGYKVTESNLRSWESSTAVSKDERRRATADLLREEVDKYGMVDVGKGVASILGISDTRLQQACTQLENEGYVKHKFNQKSMSNPSVSYPMLVLCKPEVDYHQLLTHKDDIHVINAKFEAPDGVGLLGLEHPQKVDSSRVEIVYGDKGAQKDGIIELRPGVKDLDLKNANYAQVRINIDDTHYIKGVAIYSDDLPPGKDIRFNTNKTEGTPMLGPKENTVLKPMKVDKLTGEIDWDNPFGSEIKKGGQIGALNIVNEEGDWGDWSKTLSAQFLSKQSEKLAKRQLDLAYAERQERYEEIMSLTNPIVKQQLLNEFGDQCDTASANLKAAAMPRQSTGLLLPVNSMKPDEIYARNYDDGTRVCLVRYPHGGVFEIPQLTVNNKNKEAMKMIGDSVDAVGIHYTVAQQLSGADFDGDTVIVIPNNKGDVRAQKALEGLKNFDPKIYKLPPDAPGITDRYKQKQMGIVSNLITDMTLKGAPAEHIVRAVKHSMVVIDSEKHHLDWKQSEKDQNIDELRRLYQQKVDAEGNVTYGGASTLISRSNAKDYVEERKPGYVKIDPLTGEKTYPDWTLTGNEYVNKHGKTVKKMSTVHRMNEVSDARELLSTFNGGKGTAMEQVYAEYANNMKALANNSRVQAAAIVLPKRNPEAAKEYKEEVQALKERVAEARAWSPRERHAHLYAETVVAAKRTQYPDMDSKQLKKVRNMALREGRARLGGKSPRIEFSDREWEAIQKGALAPTTAKDVFRFVDKDYLKQKAMPKASNNLSTAQIATIKSLIASGHSYESVAKRYGVSLTTIQRVAKK